MFKKNKNTKKDDTIVEIVKTPHSHKESSFSVFQIIIFSFLFVLMIWIIGFFSLDLDGQKQQIQVLNSKVDNMEKGGAELLNSYVDKIRDLQKIDIKEQVQEFGMDIKDNIQRVRELMFDKHDLDRLEEKITALEEYNKTYRGANLLLLTSTTLLRDAINRGDAFEVELENLVAIGGENKLVKDAEQTLKSFSKTGIKTLNQLRNDFDSIADDVAFMAKNPKGEGDNARERFLFRLKSLFKIRKVDFDETSKDDENNSDIIVAKVQDYLKKSDLENAISEFERLKDVAPAGFDFAKQWYEEAKMKMSVEEVMSPLLTFSLEKSLHDISLEGVEEKRAKKRILPIIKEEKKNTDSNTIKSEKE